MNRIGSEIGEKLRMLGKPVTLWGEEGQRETWAVIDPVHSVSEAARSIEALPDGYFPPGSYQYFGLPEGDLTGMDRVQDGEVQYIIRRRERYEAAGEGLYWWALLIRGGNDDEQS